MSNGTMKRMTAAVLCGMAISAAAFGAAAESPLTTAVKVWHFADDAGLKANGAVKIGVKLDEKESPLL